MTSLIPLNGPFIKLIIQAIRCHWILDSLPSWLGSPPYFTLKPYSHDTLLLGPDGSVFCFFYASPKRVEKEMALFNHVYCTFSALSRVFVARLHYVTHTERGRPGNEAS